MKNLSLMVVSFYQVLINTIVLLILTALIFYTLSASIKLVNRELIEIAIIEQSKD